MPKASTRQGSIHAFDKFRIQKPSANIGKKHVKAQSKQIQIDDIKLEPSSEAPALERSSSSASAISIPEPQIERPTLNEADPRFIALAKQIKSLRRTPQIHHTTSTIETILRDFDMTSRYGPAVGITRLQRFKRAEKLGMNPDAEIGLILETQEAWTRDDYKHELFYGRL